MAIHTRAARENILDRIIQDVAQSEHPGDIWRRHHDRERRLGRMRVRMEIAMFEPTRVPFLFDARRVVILWKFRHRGGIIRESGAIASW